MIPGKILKKLFCVAVVLQIVAGLASAQYFPVKYPKQERLLNGLRVLMWHDPAAQKVSAKLRIHAGAAFDQQGKEGTVALLADSIFPNDNAREFFKDDLGGFLEITTNYDYIEISASSRPEEYLTMLDTLASAITRPKLDKATLDPVKTRLAAKVETSEKAASYVADRAVAKRLLETFPYGRPVNGTVESLKVIDFADLKFAYDRLVGADNATLTVSGNFPIDVGYRAIRRYFGSWLKSDKKVPSTFRQPDPPASAAQILESPESGITEIRYAIRGVARNSADYAAASVLASILEQRLKAKAPEDQRAKVFVRNQSNVLPGLIVLGFSGIQRPLTAEVTNEKPKADANDLIAQILNEPVTGTEFNSAKTAATAVFGKRDVQSQWLDADTFRLANVKADQDAFAAVTLADVQRFAERIRKEPIASVLVLAPKSAD